jgi:hypothetical protein
MTRIDQRHQQLTGMNRTQGPCRLLNKKNSVHPQPPLENFSLRSRSQLKIIYRSTDRDFEFSIAPCQKIFNRTMHEKIQITGIIFEPVSFE